MIFFEFAGLLNYLCMHMLKFAGTFVQNDTPLGFAAGHNHVSIVRWLLSDDVGADINAQDSRVICLCKQTPQTY